MAAKKRAAAFLGALVALIACTSVSASIPRNEIFAPAFDRFAFENAPPARPESAGALPLVDQLRSAADAAWPIESLPETRVGVFEFVEPLVPQPEPQLSRALRQGYERLERRRASGDEYQDSSNLYAFAGGDPVNGRDPTGEYDAAKAGHAINAGANWLKNKIGQASASKPRSGIAAVDAVNDIQDVVMETTVNTGIDLVAGAFSGLLTIGEASGTAIVEEGCHDLYSCGMTGSAILGDVSSTVLYATGIAGAAESRVAGLRRGAAPRAAVPAPRVAQPVRPRTRYDATKLSAEQVDRAVLKSIRRKSGATGTSSGEIAATADQTEFILQKVTSWRRNVHASNSNLSGLPANVKGTLLHTSVQTRIGQLNIRGLAVNERIYGASPFVSPNTGLPYQYRIPDFRSPTTIFDIKPAGTPMAGPQYIDFGSFSGLSDIRWITYAPF